MDFYDLEKLKRDKKQNFLYDMFVATFKASDSKFDKIKRVNVTEEQTMRLDLVSQEQYSNDDFVDALCSLNYIDNPLNIMMGDELVCPSVGQIIYFRLDEVAKDSAVSELVDPEKAYTVDDNRKKYVEQNYTLTPTSIESPQDPVKVVGNDIIIGQ